MGSVFDRGLHWELVARSAESESVRVGNGFALFTNWGGREAKGVMSSYKTKITNQGLHGQGP